MLSFVRPDIDDTIWQAIDLPHDWAVALPFDKDGNKGEGSKALGPRWDTNIGWYRRSFDLPADDAGKTLSVEFDGVFRNSVVWINGHCLGRNVSGYTGFWYDISKYAVYGGKNVLVVRVDATRTEGWFYEGAGIYRHVWLVKTSPVHLAHWGTFVTNQVDGNTAKTDIQTHLRNHFTQPVDCTLVSRILDADGKIVGEVEQPKIHLEPDGDANVDQNLMLASPNLWSIETPYLYRLESIVKIGDATSDVYETNFGVRTIRFDPDLGFFLNGKHVEILGTCNHQDAVGVGTALPDRMQYLRVEQLKAMGCNAYRTSHGDPTPELLDACDRLGMLVMDEHRKMGTTPEILSQLQRLVERDRNHPSVFIWSIGNEETGVQGSDAGAPIATTMQDLVHQLDPTRLCTEAMNRDWEKGFSKVIDVQGFNYIRRYSVDQFHKDFPSKPEIGTEQSSVIGTRGAYIDDGTNKYPLAYDDGNHIQSWVSTAEQWWKFFLARPFTSGGFVWTGFDYRGEPYPYNLWPTVNAHYGIMDLCGFPKDVYYYYQANWTDQPVLHIFPHWNWHGKEGQLIPVWCYSNLDEVELFLNGTSLGRQKVNRLDHLEWHVVYDPGTLLARGYKDGQQVAEEQIETTGPAVAIKLTPDRATIDADGRDVSMVTVQALDAQGRPVPTANNFIRFDITGGKIIGTGNGDQNSLEPEKQPQRSLFNGLAMVVVQSNKGPGDIQLSATSVGLTPTTLHITAAPAAGIPAVP
jgi:beta-galactosidase